MGFVFHVGFHRNGQEIGYGRARVYLLRVVGRLVLDRVLRGDLLLCHKFIAAMLQAGISWTGSL